jgi:N-acetyl-anhydromuramyl-L-alanine amidase AmpD
MADLYPNVVLRRNVRNQSSRNGIKPTLIVVHSTESSNVAGTADLAAIAAWFDNPVAQASSHVCTDADGHSARMVPDGKKAWHCAGYNSVSLGVEQVGRAAQGSWSDKEIEETARWIARWSREHGIPIRKGEVSNGRVVRSGVLRHSDLGVIGGGHHDPGDGYPLDRLLRRARAIFKAVGAKKRGD